MPYPLCTLAQPEVLRRATGAITGKDMQGLVNSLFFALVAGLLFVLSCFFRDIWLRKSQNYYEKEIGSRMLKGLLNTKMSRLGRKKFGDVSTALIRNGELFVSSGISAITDGSSGYFALILTFTYMCIIQWQLALAVLVYNLVIRVFAVFVERKISKNAVEASEAVKQSANQLSAVLKNMLMVRIYSNRDFFGSRTKKREKAVMKTGWKSFVWTNGFQDFIWAFSKMAEFVIVYGVGAALIYSGISDMSILMTFVFANDLFTIGINSISYYMQSRAESGAYMDSINEILEEKETENEQNLSLSKESALVSFKNVSFSYGEKSILNNASFTIAEGEKVLLKGANGQGKSTILKLICGLYRPDGGEVYYGGKALSGVNIASISQVCGYISQHSNILEGDLISNLALSNTGDSQRAQGVLNRLSLGHSPAASPKGFSMGEKQRLNIGRAIYRGGHKLLLCDEIFANIDKENREAVLKLIKEDYKNATVIMISHEDIPYEFNRVLSVENGGVREVLL